MSSFKSFWQNFLFPGLLAVAVTSALLVGMAFLANPADLRWFESPVASTPSESDPPRIVEPEPEATPVPTFVPQQPAGPSRSQIVTLNALWANCESATRNNARGDYPAMQRMACYDYQAFAQKIGVQANAVAAVREAMPQPMPDRAYREQQADQECLTCQSLFAEKDRLDERMRRHAYSPREGEYLRDRERKISDRLYQLRCSRFSRC